MLDVRSWVKVGFVRFLLVIGLMVIGYLGLV